MSGREKTEKLSEKFMVLSEEGKQYALAIVDALAYAATVAEVPPPSDEALKKPRKKTRNSGGTLEWKQHMRAQRNSVSTAEKKLPSML